MTDTHRIQISVDELFDKLNEALDGITVDNDPDVKIRDIKTIKKRTSPQKSEANWHIEWIGISTDFNLEKSDTHTLVKAVMNTISTHQDLYDIEW